MHDGHGGRAAEAAIDAERFFRAVDRGITEHRSRPSGLPLVLAAVPQHRPLFHDVSHNPLLVDLDTDGNPEILPIDELRQRAWLAM